MHFATAAGFKQKVAGSRHTLLVLDWMDHSDAVQDGGMGPEGQWGTEAHLCKCSSSSLQATLAASSASCCCLVSSSASCALCLQPRRTEQSRRREYQAAYHDCRLPALDS